MLTYTKIYKTSDDIKSFMALVPVEPDRLKEVVLVSLMWRDDSWSMFQSESDWKIAFHQQLAVEENIIYTG